VRAEDEHAARIDVVIIGEAKRGGRKSGGQHAASEAHVRRQPASPRHTRRRADAASGARQGASCSTGERARRRNLSRIGLAGQSFYDIAVSASPSSPRSTTSALTCRACSTRSSARRGRSNASSCSSMTARPTGRFDLIASLTAGWRDKVVILRQANSGASAATNAGARRASLPWLKLVDGDDLLCRARPRRCSRRRERWARRSLMASSGPIRSAIPTLCARVPAPALHHRARRARPLHPQLPVQFEHHPRSRPSATGRRGAAIRGSSRPIRRFSCGFSRPAARRASCCPWRSPPTRRRGACPSSAGAAAMNPSGALLPRQRDAAARSALRRLGLSPRLVACGAVPSRAWRRIFSTHLASYLASLVRVPDDPGPAIYRALAAFTEDGSTERPAAWKPGALHPRET